MVFKAIVMVYQMMRSMKNIGAAEVHFSKPKTSQLLQVKTCGSDIAQKLREKVLLSPLKFLIFPVVAWEGPCQNFFCSSSHGATAQLQLFLPEAVDGTFQPFYLAISQCRNDGWKKYVAYRKQVLINPWKYLRNRGFRRKFFCALLSN